MKKNISKAILLLTLLAFIGTPVLKAQTKEQIEKALNDAYEKFKNLKEELKQCSKMELHYLLFEIFNILQSK